MSYLYVVLAYLLGSIPFGLLLARIAGIDIRTAGSGNIGATNVNRLLGKKLGVLTLVADASKGLLPVILAGRLLEGSPDRELWMLLCGGGGLPGPHLSGVSQV